MGAPVSAPCTFCSFMHGHDLGCLKGAQERRDTGIALADQNADAAWRAHAWEVLRAYLRTHAEFFVDAFWNESGLERPREARALGALVQRAAREGLMEKTGEYRKSVASNLSPKPVWRSLLGRREATVKTSERSTTG